MDCQPGSARTNQTRRAPPRWASPVWPRGRPAMGQNFLGTLISLARPGPRGLCPGYPSEVSGGASATRARLRAGFRSKQGSVQQAGRQPTTWPSWTRGRGLGQRALPSGRAGDSDMVHQMYCSQSLQFITAGVATVCPCSVADWVPGRQ